MRKKSLSVKKIIHKNLVNNLKKPKIKLVYSEFKKPLNSKKLKWVGYLSTTGIYGDTKGEWVNENTSPNTQQDRSIRRLS